MQFAAFTQRTFLTVSFLGALPLPIAAQTKAVSQLLWPEKDREEWFSLGENHEKTLGFGLHQLRNRCSRSTTAVSAKQETVEWVYRIRYDFEDKWFQIFCKIQLAILEPRNQEICHGNR